MKIVPKVEVKVDTTEITEPSVPWMLDDGLTINVCVVEMPASIEMFHDDVSGKFGIVDNQIVVSGTRVIKLGSMHNVFITADSDVVVNGQTVPANTPVYFYTDVLNIQGTATVYLAIYEKPSWTTEIQLYGMVKNVIGEKTSVLVKPLKGKCRFKVLQLNFVDGTIEF